MGMGVDQTRQDGCLAEINDACVHWNLDLRLAADLRDALALQQHHLIGLELAALAVEQAAGAQGDHARSGTALKRAAVGPEAWRRARAAPGCARASRLLGPERRRKNR